MVPVFSLRRAPTCRLLQEPDRANRTAGLQAVDFQGDVAGVEVHEVAVEPTHAADHVQRVGSFFSQVVGSRSWSSLAAVGRVEVVEGRVQQWPVLGQQVGKRSGGVLMCAVPSASCSSRFSAR